MFEAEAIEDAGFSVLWLGLVMVPLECFVVTVGDEDDDPDRVVSFSSANHVNCCPKQSGPYFWQVSMTSPDQDGCGSCGSCGAASWHLASRDASLWMAQCFSIRIA